MIEAENEIVAEAGTRLRIIADGMLAIADTCSEFGEQGESRAWRSMARNVDEVRVRLCALPLEAEGEE